MGAGYFYYHMVTIKIWLHYQVLKKSKAVLTVGKIIVSGFLDAVGVYVAYYLQKGKIVIGT